MYSCTLVIIARMVCAQSCVTGPLRGQHSLHTSRTLVGSGLKSKTELRRPVSSLIPSHIDHVAENVKSFNPSSNSIVTTAGRTLSYDSLIVAPGLQINFDKIEGLPKALADPTSGVSSIYSYTTCDKTWSDIDALRSGRAIFTQPQGVIKCAGGEFLTSVSARILGIQYIMRLC